MKNLSSRQILVLIMAFLTVVGNILANALPLNGQTTGEISDRFQVYFVPAGYVFSIWGVIYIGILAYAVYQASTKAASSQRLGGIAGLFIGSCCANIAWLFLWHYNLFALTLVAMLSLLVLLALIYLKLQTGMASTSRYENWSVDIPFKIYLGWISVATIANVTDVLSYYRWDGFGVEPITWAQILMVVGAILAISFYIIRKDLVIPFVIIWAYIGIGIKFKGITQLSSSAWAMAFLIAFMMFTLDLGKKIKAGSEIPPPGLSDKK